MPRRSPQYVSQFPGSCSASSRRVEETFRSEPGVQGFRGRFGSSFEESYEVVHVRQRTTSFPASTIARARLISAMSFFQRRCSFSAVSITWMENVSSFLRTPRIVRPSRIRNSTV